MQSRSKGITFVLICVALWALIPVVAKLGQSGLDNHQFLFWSSLVSFVVLALFAFFNGKTSEIKEINLREWAYLTMLGLLGTYIYYLFLYLGYSHAIGLEVLVFQYLWPIFIVVFSLTILKEKLSGKKIVAILLGSGGVLIVLTKGQFSDINLSNPGVVSLVAIGAACFALFSVLSKRVKRNTYVVVTFYFMVASAASFISMLVFSEFAFPDFNALLPILLNGILVNGFSYVFWQIALRSTQASFLAPFVFITPVLSALYLILFFNETFVWSIGLGLFLIINGGLINSLKLKSEK